MTPGFLASAPPPGAEREAYFERAAEAPEWVDVVLSPAVTLRVSRDVVRGGGVRLPLWPSTAQRIADRYDAMLPTERLSDVIWRAGVVKVEPRPMTPRPGASRDSNALLAEHEALVNAAVAGRAGLIVGAKKDVIVGASVPRTPGKVFIYGWHRANGEPVQPVFGGHSARYSDYSHGARLVSRIALVHGVRTPIESLFANPATAALVSKTGPLGPSALRYPTG
jgi:hypothetical protein